MPTATLRRAPAAAALLVLCSASPALAQGVVWRVAGDGSGDFEEIQPAVDAAADGDVILVAPGGYAPFKITGKGLRVHGSGASVVNVSAALPIESMLVEGTAAHQTVVLDGLSAIAFAAGSPGTVRVSGCAGPVWMHNLFIDSFGAESLHVEASASVVLDRCVLQTNLSTPSALGQPQPEAGARIDGGARVFAYDSEFQGSHGPLVGSGIPVVVEPEDGGPGILLVDAEAHLFGCALAGGSGNLLSVAGCLTGGEGGDGALLMTAGGTPPLLLVTGGTVQPGGGGFFDPSCAPPPAPGSAFDVQAGAVQHAGVTPRLVHVAQGAPFSGAQVQFAIEAAAGDIFLLFASGAAAPAFTLPLGASPFGLDLHLAPAPLVMVLASSLANPVTTLALTAPTLPPGLEMAAPALQALFLDAQGGLHASTPRALTVIAP